MFSVIIPLYNKELSIRNTIQSVLDQTFQDFEVVIVNDGSTDSSVAVVESFTDPRIRLIHQKNQGVSAARNKGIKEAKNDWIAFLDGDDLWKDMHLAILRHMIVQYPHNKVFCTSYIKSNKEVKGEPDPSLIVIDNYFEEAIRYNFFWTSATCLHHSVFQKVGVFDIRLTRGEDLDMWARIGRAYTFIKSNMVTAIYRTDAENRSILSFNLDKTRIYHYDFDSSTTLEETQYYKNEIIRNLRGFIRKGDFYHFIKLKRKHTKHIKLIDIFKRSV